ncbi:hypothetical protein SAMD00019534_001310 [Acytostelium subglobosum LB1]|uniref:hypothetical protein n=1 Tax=Acytostelium subglobosum LB1 TaxID=1410327 RepID=UPI00064480C6|nr:hypothetical protein SAMD00019534_001310 [Acytostelium subglobosum LB1]GAM16956.1 hypothetical protein SAMD00019534_001310 [Acytostelium subglobosum LB1]|eukprot:XP_012759018.1 hypothetical protein SAMD00019534_001310 [Acytostelium subglobosum LB1]
MSAPPRLSARASLLDRKPGGPLPTLKTSGGITKPSSSSPPISHRTSTSSLTPPQQYNTPSTSGATTPTLNIHSTSSSSYGGGGYNKSAPQSAPSTPSHSRLSSGNLTNYLIPKNAQLSRVSGHSRKASRGGSGGTAAAGPRWGSNVLSYQDYVDEELFYSTPTEEDDEEFEQIKALLNSEYSVTTHQSLGQLKGGSLVVLSWKNDAAQQVEEQQLEDDKRDLAFLKETLAKTTSLSNQMVFILDRFNEGLTTLEQDVAPINASMKEWSTVYNNINLTMESMRTILERFDLSKVAQKIREGAKGDYASYMATLDHVVQSIDFFEANPQFKAAEKTLSTLKELKSTGLSELENNFKSLLLKISNIVDPTTIPALPAAKRYLAIVPPNSVEEISKSIELFQRLKYHNYQKEYKDKRSKFILMSLNKLAPEKFIKVTTESKNLAYVKGSHPLIGYTHETLRLYQIESDLAKELFGDQYHSFLEEIVHPSHELLLDTTEPIIKAKKTVDKVFGIFPLLDLFDTFTKLLPEFAGALSQRDGKHISDIKEIIKNLENTCSALLDFSLEEEFRKEEKLDQSTTVDQVTSNMLNYFKRLIEYKGSVEFLLTRSKSSFKDFTEKTLRTLSTYLQTKSKKDFTVISSTIELNNKVPFRGIIFLINNYQYIVESLGAQSILDAQSYLLKEMETACDNEIKIYREFWMALSEPLRPGKDVETKAIVKRHTNFLKTMTEISKMKFEIPDHELRTKLSNIAKDSVTKTYERFKEKCRQDKTHLEKNFAPFESNDDINRKIDKMFESQY